MNYCCLRSNRNYIAPAAQEAAKKAKEESQIDMVLSMNNEGLLIPMIAKISKLSEDLVTQIIENHTNTQILRGVLSQESTPQYLSIFKVSENLKVSKTYFYKATPLILSPFFLLLFFTS